MLCCKSRTSMSKVTRNESVSVLGPHKLPSFADLTLATLFRSQIFAKPIGSKKHLLRAPTPNVILGEERKKLYSRQ